MIWRRALIGLGVAAALVVGSGLVFLVSLFVVPWQGPPDPHLPAPVSTTR